VEVVDQDTRWLNETRSKLITELRSHDTIVKQFSGCLINVVTSHDEPRLPIDTDDIITQIIEIGKKIDTLPIKKTSIKNLNNPPGYLQIWLSVQRLSSSGHPIINSSGSSAITTTNWLLQSVQKKVEKKYAAPVDEFWLLAYGSEKPLLENDSHVHETATFLDSTIHQFNEVWYFFPLPNAYGGSVFRIWQRN